MHDTPSSQPLNFFDSASCSAALGSAAPESASSFRICSVGVEARAAPIPCRSIAPTRLAVVCSLGGSGFLAAAVGAPRLKKLAISSFWIESLESTSSAHLQGERVRREDSKARG